MSDDKIEQENKEKPTPSAEDNTVVDDDSTIVLSLQASTTRQELADEATPAERAINNELVTAAGNNLFSASSTLLNIAAELRRPHTNIDLAKLRQNLTLEVNAFNLKAKNFDITESQSALARYILCATLDEFVLATPWGANSNWSEYSLLNTFHQDSSGGAKFFTIMEKLQQDPAKNLPLLQLIYNCLALGYTGKYRITQGGQQQLAKIRQALYQLLIDSQEKSAQGFTVRSKLLQAEVVNQIRRVPVKRLAIITAVTLSIIFSFYFLLINFSASKTMKNLRSITVESSVTKDSKRVTK